MLEGKNITLGVCGSIAAYKIPELVRLYRASGANVKILMTGNAQYFVTPFLLQTLSGRAVTADLFREAGIAHLDAVESADLFVVAPASANMLAKMAWGLADDAVSTAVLAVRGPVLAVPAMNGAMWGNRIVRRNVKMLKDAGVNFAGPEKGIMACGKAGTGRMTGLEKILWESARLVTRQSLKGKKVLVTAGPTREYADPVRFLSNASSGKMGLAIAREAYFRGAEVTLVCGDCDVNVPDGIKVVKAVSAGGMHRAVMEEIKSADVFVANAAVSDYRFRVTAKRKMPKALMPLRPELRLTPDILTAAGKVKDKPFIVGFALENAMSADNARGKMVKKGADMMVLNDISAIQSDTARVMLVSKRGGHEILPEMPKADIARSIFDRVVKFI